MDYLKAFVIGGAICMLGQVLIDLTRLTPARILVCYVVLGVIFGGAGVYEKLVDFAGAGATVPLTGFGNTLAKGVREAVQEQGILGALTGGLKASAAGIAAAVFFGFSRRWCAVRRINPDAAGKLLCGSAASYRRCANARSSFWRSRTLLFTPETPKRLFPSAAASRPSWSRCPSTNAFST